MIASHDDDRLTFVTVENKPEIFYSVDDAIEKMTGGLRTMQHLAYTAYFCLSLFEALHEYENNLNLPPSQWHKPKSKTLKGNKPKPIKTW